LHDAGVSAPPSRLAPGLRTSLLAVLLLAILLLATDASDARPTADEARGRTRVVVLSDFNESYGSVHYSSNVDGAVARAIALAPDLVISTGDMVAGQRLAPPLDREEVSAMWRAFHRRVSDPLAAAGLAFAVTPGNHDASSGERFRLEREVYREQWLARRPAVEFVDATDYPFQYAFRVGDVLFASLDATYVGHLSHAAKNWLRDLLGKVGPDYRHRVVFSHIPLWPFSVGRESDFLGDPELEEILQHGQVDLHLTGHHHAYYPGYKDGVRYVSQGCLGAAPRPLIGTKEIPARSLVVIDFDPAGPVRVEAYAGPGFAQVIPRSMLPPRIESRRATFVRDDLAASGARAGPGGIPER
jgi:3',5'-cyclic AMP phosphodiesterase CpdA